MHDLCSTVAAAPFFRVHGVKSMGNQTLSYHNRATIRSRNLARKGILRANQDLT
jgi:hypothetical protein